MNIHWSFVAVLFFLGLPGVWLAIPRLMKLLLPNNTQQLVQRISKLALFQTLLMLFLLILAGSTLSNYTNLNAPLLTALLNGEPILTDVFKRLLPVFLSTLVGFVLFMILYYRVFDAYLDGETKQAMKRMRMALGLDGCMLFGGIVEELLARWGLMNLTAFFILLFTHQQSPYIILVAIVLNGLFLSIGQLPAYYAAGCRYGRRFLYALVTLNLSQAILFGLLFWHYGLLSAIASHMLFHLGWWLCDHKIQS